MAVLLSAFIAVLFDYGSFLEFCGSLTKPPQALQVKYAYTAHLPSCYHSFVDDDDVVPHFPMCSLLKDKKFWLGRNCRMLSMQAMEKSATLGIGGVSYVN